MSESLTLEKDLDLTLLERISRLPGGEQVKQCIQCGTCSASCPVSHHMDHPPRQLIAMIRAGMEQEVLTANTLWWCLSCYSCTVRCPKNIKFTDLMYSLKRIAVRKNLVDSHYRWPKLSSAFVAVLEKYGRNQEGELIFRFFMNYNPLKMFSVIKTGMKLLKTGRLTFIPKKINGVDELKSIICKAGEMGVD